MNTKLIVGFLVLAAVFVTKNPAWPQDSRESASKNKDVEAEQSVADKSGILPDFYYPGEPLDKDEIRIIIMGCTSTPRRGQQGTSYFVQLGNGDGFMFDCGVGVTANYLSAGIAPSQMDKVFLTHLHVDHIADLPYIYSFLVAYDRKTPFHVWGPSGETPDLGTAAALEGMKAFTHWHRRSFDTIVQVDRGYELEVTELDYRENPGVAYDRDGVVIRHFPAVHQNGTIGYRLEWNGLSVVFGTDGVPSMFTLENGKNADVLIHEVAIPTRIWAEKAGILLEEAERIHSNAHTTPLALGYVLSQVQPRLCIATHNKFDEMINQITYDDIRKHYDGDVILARDLQVFNVSKERIEKRLAVVPEFAWPVDARKYKSSELPPPRLPKSAMMQDWLWDNRIRPVEWLSPTRP